jgi:hypothetical protein
VKLLVNLLRTICWGKSLAVFVLESDQFFSIKKY